MRPHTDPSYPPIKLTGPLISSALRDFKVKEGETKRHMLRITPQAERPFFDPSV